MDVVGICFLQLKDENSKLTDARDRPKFAD